MSDKRLDYWLARPASKHDPDDELTGGRWVRKGLSMVYVPDDDPDPCDAVDRRADERAEAIAKIRRRTVAGQRRKSRAERPLGHVVAFTPLHLDEADLLARMRINLGWIKPICEGCGRINEGICDACLIWAERDAVSASWRMVETRYAKSTTRESEVAA